MKSPETAGKAIAFYFCLIVAIGGLIAIAGGIIAFLVSLL